MNKVYTGYYAKAKIYKQQGIHIISISGKLPSWIICEHWKFLAPTWDIFSKWKSGEISNEEYTKRFKEEVLEKVDKDTIRELLTEATKNHDIVLMCYEKPDDFCHRHIVAEWITKELGILVEEWEN